MIQRLLTLLILIIFVNPVLAQKGSTKRPFVFSKAYKSSWGVGFGFYPIEALLQQGHIATLNYAPQLDLTNKRSDYSISLNTQIAGGYHVPFKKDTTGFFYASAPIFVQMNFGHLASKDFYNDLGYFFGIGYDPNIFQNRFLQNFAFTGGMRTWFFGKSITARYILSIPQALLDPVLHTFSLNINVGSYLENVKSNNKISDFGIE